MGKFCSKLKEGSFYCLLTLIILTSCTKTLLINKISDYSNEDKVTTSINDAELDIPYLDDFNPDAFASMIILPRSTNGGFQLRPGLFEFNAQSYCLHAGKYGPTKGEGYLSAPLNGSRADIIRNILRNSTQYADIPQNEIQLLLWGILANTKISDMSKEVQLAASRLLTPLELISINGGVIGLIPDKLLEKTISSLPLQIQSTLKLESQIRQLLTKANASYKEIENIAVKLGAAPIGEGSRTIPSGRWSFNPNGYFIRYFPSGYSETKIQVYVPEQFFITRDNLDRITSIENSIGDRIETLYNEKVRAIPISGNQRARAFAFRSVLLTSSRLQIPERKIEIKSSGWTLIEPSEIDNADSGNAPLNTYPDFDKRCKRAIELKTQINQMLKKQAILEDSNKTTSLLFNLANYGMAIETVIQASTETKNMLNSNHLQMIKKAWQSEFSRYFIKSNVSNLASEQVTKSISHSTISNFSNTKPSSPTEIEFDPSGITAMPGNTSRQRLAQSGRSSKPVKKCEEFPGGSIEYEFDENGNIVDLKPTIHEKNPCVCPCVEMHEQVHVNQKKSLIPQLMKCYSEAEQGKRPGIDCWKILMDVTIEGETEAYNVSIPCIEERLKNAKECQSKENQEYGKRKLESEKCFRDSYGGNSNNK